MNAMMPVGTAPFATESSAASAIGSSGGTARPIQSTIRPAASGSSTHRPIADATSRSPGEHRDQRGVGEPAATSPPPARSYDLERRDQRPDGRQAADALDDARGEGPQAVRAAAVASLVAGSWRQPRRSSNRPGWRSSARPVAGPRPAPAPRRGGRSAGRRA